MGSTKADRDVKQREAELDAWRAERDKLRARRAELQGELKALDLDSPQSVSAALARLGELQAELTGIGALLDPLQTKIEDAETRAAEAREAQRAAELANAEPERDNAINAVAAAVIGLSEALERMDRANRTCQSLGGTARKFRGHAELVRVVRKVKDGLQAEPLPVRPAEVTQRWVVAGEHPNKPGKMTYIRTTEVR